MVPDGYKFCEGLYIRSMNDGWPTAILKLLIVVLLKDQYISVVCFNF